MTLRTIFLALLLPLLSLSGAGAQPLSQNEIEAHLKFLASPLTEGRGLGTRGLDVAALYIETEFKLDGLQPAFGDSYRQPFELLGSTPDPNSKLTLPGEKELRYGDDFVVFSSRRDVPEHLQGELVYAGYLIDAPERNWDDIKGTPLKGKVLLVEVNEPGNEEGGIFEGPQMTYYGRWTYKYEQAARLGAKGVLLIHNTHRATYGWSVVKNSWSQEGFTIASEYLGSPFEGWITEEVARKAVKASGLDYDQLLESAQGNDFKPVDLHTQADLTFRPTFRTISTENVGGMLAASTAQPSLAPTIVVTAHHDHFGLNKKGEAYAGVVDNASAVSTMLSLARYFSQHRLPVNLLFVAVSAEEQGLWGSRFLAANPPVAKDKLWADINLEMTNIWGRTEDVYAIGADQSDLDDYARRAAEQVGLRYIPEQDKENGFFFRSDQFSFARAGVPGLWPHEGLVSVHPAEKVHEHRRNYRATHYHQTTDSLAVMSQEWNLEGTLEIANWARAMIELLAHSKVRPEFKKNSAFSR